MIDMKTRMIVFSISMAIAFSTRAQKIQLEIDLGKFRFNELKGIKVGDSIFLTLEAVSVTNASKTGSTGDAVTINKSYWLLPNGESKEVDLPKLVEKSFLATAKSNDTTYYYFAEWYKKGAKIKALALSKNGKGQISDRSILLDTRLYGRYVENGSLYLLTAEKSAFGLRLIQLNGLSIVGERNFPLSFDLGKNKRASISFYEANSPIMPSQATDPIKIIKEKDAIVICVDEYKLDYTDPNAPPTSLFRTIVARLDLVTGEVTNRLFMETTPVYFNSTVFNNYLYRIVLDAGLKTEVFDLSNGQKVTSYIIPEKAKTMNTSVYSRNEESLMVKKTEGVEPNSLLRFNRKGFLIVEPSPLQDSLQITMGVYGEIYHSVPLVHSLGLLGVLVPTMATIGANALDDRKYYQYFYMKSNQKNESLLFQKGNTGLLLQKIDEYEMQRGEVYAIKGYIPTQNAIYGIYGFKNSPIVQVIKFE